MAKRHSNDPALIPAAAYYRMSTDKQEASIPRQRHAVEQYAQSHGYKIVREYLDEGISGNATEKRFGFLRMMDDAAKGEWSTILCDDQSRFGRFNSITAGRYIWPLLEHKVLIVSVATGAIDLNTPHGRMLFGFGSEANHDFLVKLARGTVNGKLEKARLGKLFGRLPLGYRKAANGKIEPDENAHLVIDAFESYAAGVTVRSIAGHLSANGFRTKMGDLIHPSNILQMLSNPIYIGRYVWGAKKKGKYATAAETIDIADNHPAIIDRPLFDRVQKGILRRRNKKSNVGTARALSCLLKCECGKTLSVETGLEGRRTVYRCKSEKYYRHTCRALRVPAEVIEPAVLSAISDTFAAPRIQTELRREIRAEIKRRAAASQRAPGALEKRVGKLRAKLRSAEERLLEVSVDMLPRLEQMVREQRAELRTAEAELVAAGHQSPKAMEDAQREVLEMLADLSNQLAKLPGPEANQLLFQIVDRVDVEMDVADGRVCTRRGESRYTLTGGTIYLSERLVDSMLFPV